VGFGLDIEASDSSVNTERQRVVLVQIGLAVGVPTHDVLFSASACSVQSRL
jgi:hypothetical protein